MGDFNFYRSDENRNRPSGNFNDSLVFNNIISHLGLIELPIKVRSYTWSNMQSSPFLNKWTGSFTSVSWTSYYPHTKVLPLARITSDHLPCKVQIGTRIPKANIFRFENFWFNHPGCFEQISSAWAIPVSNSNSAHVISGKFKILRRILKLQARKFSNLSRLISNCNITISFFDKLEIRNLYPQELSFRVVLKAHIKNLLAMHQAYWRKRFTQRLVQFRDENTKFFHAMATERYRRNVICQIMDDTIRMVSDHNEKSSLFSRNLGEDQVLQWIPLCNLIYNSSFSLVIAQKIYANLLAKKKLMQLFLIFPMIKLLAQMGLTVCSLRKPHILLGMICTGYAWTSIHTWLISRVLTIHTLLQSLGKTILRG